MIVTPGTRRGVLALAVAIAAELASPAAEVGGGARVAPLQGELSIRDRALEAASSRNWPEAARQYRLAVEADPDSTTLRLDLGAALESVGDARGALAQYREALRLDSKLARADYRLGALLERAGRDQEAIEHYTAAVTQDPNFGVAHLKLADVLRRTDRLELAFSHYRRVIELEPATRRRTITGPEAEDARFGEAMALVRLTRFAEARDSLSMGIRVHPTQPAFRLALARVLAAAPDDLVRDGERAWELMGALLEGQQQPAVFETAAMALAELGHFDLAVDWQRLAMSAAANAGRSDVAQQMSANLALYVGRQPCRTPWRDDDPDHRPGPPVDLELLDRPAAR